MKALIVLLLLSLYAAPLVAQPDALFKIISCSKGVKIDGKEVKPGMNVGPKSISLVIPPGGYAGIINNEGWLLEIKQSMKVNAVNKFFTGRFVKSKLTTDTVHRAAWNLKFPMAPENSKSIITIDSLFLYWLEWDFHELRQPQNTVFTLRFQNMFLETIDSIQTTRNWLVVDMKERWKNNTSLILEVAGYNPSEKSEQRLIKTDSTFSMAKPVEDLKRIPASVDHLFYEAAILELNNLGYDQNLVIYKILASKKSPTDRFLKLYYKKLTSKYRFDVLSVN